MQIIQDVRLLNYLVLCLSGRSSLTTFTKDQL